MTGFAIEKAYLRIPQGQLHLRRGGRGPAILLLHQSPSSGAMWEPLLPRLAQAGYEVLAPDLPGFGNSYRPADPPSLADYADAVRAALDALGAERIDVVGHHTGAAVALQLAASAPQRVRRMVLWGVPLMDPALHHRLLHEECPVYDDAGEFLRAQWVRRRELSGRAYRPEIGIRAAIEMLQTGSARPWGHWAVARADVAGLLGRVPQPTLVLAGQRDPVWARSREAASLLADGRFACIEDAGLDVVDECTEAFLRHVVDFLGAGR